MCELMETRQEMEESISKFIQRFETLMKCLTVSVSNDTPRDNLLEGRLHLLQEMALSKFIHFTNAKISDRLRGSALTILNEAYTLAPAEETALRLISSNPNSQCITSKFTPNASEVKSDRKDCHNCKSTTHNANNCFRSQTKNPTPLIGKVTHSQHLLLLHLKQPNYADIVKT